VKKYYSKLKDSTILYAINRESEIKEDRQDLSPETEYLQVSCKKLRISDSFRPHKHLPLERKTLTTHESWVIIKGSIRAQLFDLDDTLYSEEILSSGDCLVCFAAGHSFDVLEDETLLYEFKNGPYYGVKKDKQFI
jgi:hypothetical protein